MPLPVPLESIPFKAATVMMIHRNLKPHHVILQLNTAPYDFFFRVQNKVSTIIFKKKNCLHAVVYGTLVPQPGNETVPPALEG